MGAYYNEKNNPIAICRTEKNLSQQDLANILEINIKTLQGYEKGKSISSTNLILLAKELQVSSDYLIGLSNTKNPAYEKLWEDFALKDECIEKIRDIAKLDKDRNETLAIDTINYLFKYSNIELIEFIGEYLNTPMPPNINLNIKGKVSKEQKRIMNEQRKYEAEKYIVIQEISKLFDQIKSTVEVKQKYEKNKDYIEKYDRPINKLNDKQLNRLNIEHNPQNN